MVRKENDVVIKKHSIGKLVLLCLPVVAALIICFIIFKPCQQSTVTTKTVKKEVPQKIEQLNIEKETVSTTDSEQDSAEQIEQEEWLGECELLAALVEAEAGNQDLKGKRLVADVVLNRVESDRFPNTITEVIYQDYQFSTVLDGALEKATWNISDDSFEAVRLEAIDCEERLDEDILFFTAGGYNPYCIPGYQYQDHYFGY